MAPLLTSSPVFLDDYGAELETFTVPAKPTTVIIGQHGAFYIPDLEDCEIPRPKATRPMHKCATVAYIVVMAVIACVVGYQLGTGMFDLFAAPATEAAGMSDAVTQDAMFLDPLQNWSKVQAMDGVEIVVDAPVLFGDATRARRAANATEAYLTYEVSDMLQTVQIVTHLWDAAIAAAAASQQDDMLSLGVLQRMGGSPFRMAVAGNDGEWVELTSTFTILDTASSGWAVGSFLVEDIPPCAMFKVMFNDIISTHSRSAWRPQIAEVKMVFDHTEVN